MFDVWKEGYACAYTLLTLMYIIWKSRTKELLIAFFFPQNLFQNQHWCLFWAHFVWQCSCKAGESSTFQFLRLLSNQGWLSRSEVHTKSVDGVSSTAALFFPCLLFLKIIACLLVKAPEKTAGSSFFLSRTDGSQLHYGMIKATIGGIGYLEREVWHYQPAFWEYDYRTMSSMLLRMGWIEVLLLDSHETNLPWGVQGWIGTHCFP